MRFGRGFDFLPMAALAIDKVEPRPNHLGPTIFLRPRPWTLVPTTRPQEAKEVKLK